MASNPLNELLPQRIRTLIYVGYALLGVAVGATQVAYTSIEAEQPAWLTVTLAVYGFLGTSVGAVAASNPKVTEDRAGRNDLP